MDSQAEPQKFMMKLLVGVIVITYFMLTISATRFSSEVLERIPRLKHVQNASIAALFISILVGAFLLFWVNSSREHREEYNRTIAWNKNQSAPGKESNENWMITAYLITVTICLMIVTFTLFGIKEAEINSLSPDDQKLVKFAKISAILNFIVTFIGWIFWLVHNRSKITIENIKSTYGYSIAPSEPSGASTFYYF